MQRHALLLMLMRALPLCTLPRIFRLASNKVPGWLLLLLVRMVLLLPLLELEKKKEENEEKEQFRPNTTQFRPNFSTRDLRLEVFQT
jgi:hypothetical protein